MSVIVVSYNTAEQLHRCLQAIEPEHEVIVVDNASSDASPTDVRAAFPNAVWIQNTENRGFGAANNQGIDVATRELILLLNSDAYANPGAIRQLAEQMDDKDVAAVGGKLIYPDGRLQQSTAKPLTLWHVFLEQSLLGRFSGYWTTDPSWTSPQFVDQVMGACLMFRRDSVRFDERFFLYCEDSDLCLRLRQMGKIVYDPSAIFVHDLGASSSQEPWSGIIWYSRSKELYFQIHHGPAAKWLCLLMNRTGSALRLVLWPGVSIAQLLLKKRRTPWLTWWKTLTAPIRWDGRKR